MRAIFYPKLLALSLAGMTVFLVISRANGAYTKKQQQRENRISRKTKDLDQKDGFNFVIDNTYYSNQALTSVHRLGKTILDQVIVKGSTEVQGHLQVKDSKLSTVHVQGRTNIRDSTIQGAALIQGRTEINNTQFISDLSIQGKFFISGSTVKGELDTQGKFEALHTTFEDRVSIQGLFEVKDAVFQKEVDILGKVYVKRTSFGDTITAVAEKVFLHDVTAQDLYIGEIDQDCCERCKKDSKKCLNKKIQEVTLSGKTTLKGSIIFEAKNGIILLGKEAKIEGEVIGGTIKRL